MLRILRTTENRQKLATVAEQIVLSAASMLASIVVLGAGGVAQFGIYSAIFSGTVLVQAMFAASFHRQMVLRIADRPQVEKNAVFLATLVAELVIFLAAFTLAIPFGGFWIAVALFAALYCLFDLSRQYLIASDRHIHSLICTCLYLFTLIVLLVGVYVLSVPEKVVASVFAVNALALLAGILTNAGVIHCVSHQYWRGAAFAVGVVRSHFEQGRYSLQGSVISWVQNLSISPFLLWVADAATAGYFGIARLLLMPVSVVNNGLANAVLPRHRRLFMREGARATQLSLTRYSRLNLMLVAGFFSLLLLADVAGLFSSIIEDYHRVRPMLLIWALATMLTMQRYWVTQFFMVKNDFRYLLGVNALTATVGLLLMAGFGLLADSSHLVVMSVVVAEAVALTLLIRSRRRIIALDSDLNLSGVH